jgi:hypothetical protein
MPRTQRPKVVTITKQSAAQSQLETAISLWFDDADPLAIHMLAVAAHDCYHALAGNKAMPSYLRAFVARQSQAFQDDFRAVQNFAKHGAKKLTGTVRLRPVVTDGIIFDALCCHADLYENLTPLMKAFSARLCLEQPVMWVGTEMEGLYQEAYRFHDWHVIDRREFLEKFLFALRVSGR